MMPSNKPLTTLPTVWPRVASCDRWAANGTITCAATEPRPMASAAARNTMAPVLIAATTRAVAVTSKAVMIRRRFSSKSPSGTTNSRPRV